MERICAIYEIENDIWEAKNMKMNVIGDIWITFVWLVKQ